MKVKNGNRLTGAYTRTRERRVHRRVHPVRSTKVGTEFKKHPLFSEKQRVFCRRNESRFFWGGSGRATSALDVQPIVGETHALGQLAVCLALAAGLVAHVDEIGVLSVHSARHFHRLLDGLVRVVRLVA